MSVQQQLLLRGLLTQKPQRGAADTAMSTMRWYLVSSFAALAVVFSALWLQRQAAIHVYSEVVAIVWCSEQPVLLSAALGGLPKTAALYQQ